MQKLNWTAARVFAAILAASFTVGACLADTNADELKRSDAQREAIDLGVESADAGATLHCNLHGLTGFFDGNEVALAMSDSTGSQHRLHLAVSSFGREHQTSEPPSSGDVVMNKNLATVMRGPLEIACDVSVAGIRQTFVLSESPPGQGGVRINLAVTGARVEETFEGLSWLPKDGAHRIAIDMPRATDRDGQALPAVAELVNSETISLEINDDDAEYPIRVSHLLHDAKRDVQLDETKGVKSIAYGPTGNIYVAGNFSAAGGVPAMNVAKWDGKTWSALGNGPGRLTGIILDGVDLRNVAVDANEHVYVSGFEDGHVSMWDGVDWQEVHNSGIPRPRGVSEMLAVGSDVYVTGYFVINVFGATEERIGKWDGQEWTIINKDGASCLASDNQGRIYAAIPDDDHSHPLTQVSMWDGQSWNRAADDIYAPVSSLVCGPFGSIYAASRFRQSGYRSAILEWNRGGRWKELQDSEPLFFESRGLAVDRRDNVYVVDGYRLRTWIGYEWRDVGWVDDYGIEDMVVNAEGVVHLVGSFSNVTNSSDGSFASANGVVRWSPAGWSPMGTGLDNNDVRTLAIAGKDVYAGGTFTAAGGVATKYIARWNGENWLPLEGELDGAVYSLEVTPQNAVYVGGQFINAGSKKVNHVARWEPAKKKWSGLGDGIKGDNVFCLEWNTNSSRLYAGGLFSKAGNVAVTNVAKWAGGKWQKLGNGLNSTVYSLHMYNKNLYVGGKFKKSGSRKTPYIAHMSLGSWQMVEDNPLDSSIYAMADTHATGDTPMDLVVGGNFKYMNAENASRAALLEGTIWKDANSSFNDKVRALAYDASSSSVIAGGSFTDQFGMNYIARMRFKKDCGQCPSLPSWVPLGSGFNSHVYAVACDGAGHVYAGGTFTSADGKPASRVARWSEANWQSLGF